MIAVPETNCHAPPPAVAVVWRVPSKKVIPVWFIVVFVPTNKSPVALISPKTFNVFVGVDVFIPTLTLVPLTKNTLLKLTSFPVVEELWTSSTYVCKTVPIPTNPLTASINKVSVLKLWLNAPKLFAASVLAKVPLYTCVNVAHVPFNAWGCVRRVPLIAFAQVKSPVLFKA